MMLIVPVGAIVVVVALRSGRCPVACPAPDPIPVRSHRDPFQVGNGPRRSARSLEAASDSSSRNVATRSASASASSESYAISIAASASAHPMMPSPILRVALVARSISGRGYRFASMTSSRKRTASRITTRRRSQSSSFPTTNLPTSMLPSVHDSNGSSGCSPQL